MKKVVVDCKNLSYYSSGISGYFIPLLKSLIHYFSKVHFVLVAPKEFDTYFIDEFTNWELKVIPRKKVVNSSISLIFYDLWTFPRFVNSIEACLLISPYYDFIIPPKFINKSIITVHDLCFWEVSELYPKRIKYYFKFLLNFNITRAHSIITVSESSFNSIIKFFGQSVFSKLVIVYNTFEVSNFKSEKIIKKDNKRIILYTGGFEYRKNIENLFKVLNELKDEVNIQLLFTGNNLHNANLIRLINKYQLEQCVVLTGSVTIQELHRLYNLCDTVINISFCEGFGRSNLEAMYFDKPLVCSDLEVFKELVGEYAIYCDPYSLSSIKAGILESFCVNNDVKCTKGIERFSFEPNKNMFLETVDKILNGN